MMPGQGADAAPQGGAPTPEELNYRAATNPQQSCATCGSMMPDGTCAVLKMPVEPTMFCDAYMPKGDTMSGGGRAALEDQIFGGQNGGPAV